MKSITKLSSWSLEICALLGSCCALAAFLLNAPLGQSFWLDETITLWVSSGSLEECIERAWAYQGQSPLYFILFWCYRKAFGESQLALRLPNLLLMCASIIPLYDCSRRLKLKYGLIVIPLTLLSDPTILTQSFFIRPYACAFFCACCATAALLRWMSSGHRLWLIAYSCTLALTLYFQYLFASLALAHLALYAFTRTELKQGSLLGLLTAWSGTSLLLFPGVLHILAWIPKQAMIQSWCPPTIWRFLANIVPVEAVAFSSLGLLAGLLYVPTKWHKGNHKLLLLLLLLTLLPTTVLYVASLVGEGNYFVNRYYMWRTIGLGLLLSYLFERFNPELLKVALLCWAAFITVLNAARIYHFDDWRGVQTELSRRADALKVLFNSGLVELANVPYPEDTRTQEYLSSPFRYYPIKQKYIVIPPHFETQTTASFLKQQILPQIASEQSFILVLTPTQPLAFCKKSFSSIAYFSDVFAKQGFKVVEARRRGTIHILFFSKSASPDISYHSVAR